jgi:hypothetical protein
LRAGSRKVVTLGQRAQAAEGALGAGGGEPEQSLGRGGRFVGSRRRIGRNGATSKTTKGQKGERLTGELRGWAGKRMGSRAQGGRQRQRTIRGRSSGTLRARARVLMKREGSSDDRDRLGDEWQSRGCFHRIVDHGLKGLRLMYGGRMKSQIQRRGRAGICDKRLIWMGLGATFWED